jgi:biopolymer transport protein ExbD
VVSLFMKAASEDYSFLTPGVRPDLRQTDGYESSIEEMWRVSDWMECLIFIGLALMLVYTVFVAARFFRRYFSARREFCSLESSGAPASQRNQKNLIAELSRGVATLKSIASTAPFLGLAGTCYGMLVLFFRGYVGSRGAFLAWISREISTALVATAAGLLVAIPAAICYNVLHTRLEKFGSNRSNVLLDAAVGSFQVAQTLSLRRRFSGFPAFALIAAPVLAILVPLFSLFQRFEAPMGLPVHALKIGVTDHDSATFLVSIGVSASGQSIVYVNSKESPWEELSSAIQGQFERPGHPLVYVEARNEVPWADVVNAIDAAQGLQAEVVLLTTTPRINPSHRLGAKRVGRTQSKLGVKTGGKKLKGP